jgi:hypothetical protein
MDTPLNQRAYNVFLSHSSRDKAAFVDGLFDWLTRKAGLAVFYDRNLGSGGIASNLERAVTSSRAAIVVISSNSVSSEWVRTECDRLQEEAGRHGGDFRIATVRLDNAEPPSLLRAFKHIDATGSSLTAASAALLMDTLFGGREISIGRPVYLSRGWRPPERPPADTIVRGLQAAGLRLVCDWTDQPSYDKARIRDIMEGTGGLAAILPHRGNGGTSRYILDEIAMARDLGLPVLVFAHADVATLPPGPDPLRFGDDPAAIRSNWEDYANPIEDFVTSIGEARAGEHIFLGHSLEESIDDNFRTASQMLSRLTGLPIRVGGLVTGQDAQHEIVSLIRSAGLCIIDISNRTYENLPEKIDFALNSSIEAGIALGAGRPLYLTCRSPRRSPPFMFRNKQVWFYEDDLELIGNLRQIAARHRRMVL